MRYVSLILCSLFMLMSISRYSASILFRTGGPTQYPRDWSSRTIARRLVWHVWSKILRQDLLYGCQANGRPIQSVQSMTILTYSYPESRQSTTVTWFTEISSPTTSLLAVPVLNPPMSFMWSISEWPNNTETPRQSNISRTESERVWVEQHDTCLSTPI